MAKPIVLNHGGAVSQFDFSKVDRKKLYGRRVRMNLDPAGERCANADLTDDGWRLIRRGMASQGYFDQDGNYLSSRDLVGLDADGNPLERVGSTLGTETALEGPIAPEVLLDMKISSVYALDALEVDAALQQALEAGQIFRFAFNYRSDFLAECAVLLQNGEGVFALVGQPTESEWCELDQPPPPPVFEEEEEDDDLDFEMF